MKTQKPFYTVLNEYFTELFTEHPAKASVDIADASQLQADLEARFGTQFPLDVIQQKMAGHCDEIPEGGFRVKRSDFYLPQVAVLALMLLAMLSSCTARKYQFKKGDTVYVGSLFRQPTLFLIDSVLPGYGYTAWDLRLGTYVPKTTGLSFKPLKKK